MTPKFYLGVMKKEIVNGQSAQGAVDQEIKPPSIDEVEKWLKRDLNTCLHMLEAIYRDPDLLRSMATFMAGRMENNLLKKSLENQSN